MTRTSSNTGGEEGVALFYALLTALVVGGIVAVVAAGAIGQTRQSAFELDFEDSLHVAEGGLEVVLQRLDASSAYATVGEDGLPVLGPSSTDDPRVWAETVATEPNTTSPSGYNLPAVDFGEGEAVSIRPTGRDADFAYGVGFVPSRDAFVAGQPNAYIRVLRMKVGFTDTEVAGSFAVLAGAELTTNSNTYGVLGLNGKIHTNGQLSISHDQVAGDGTITYSDTGPSGCTGVCPPDPGVVGPVEQELLPSATIDDLWARPDAQKLASEGAWFDYCSGAGRHVPTGGPGWYQRQPGDSSPCSGTKLASEPTGWSGLRLSNSTDPNAVYWLDVAFGTDLDVQKMAGRASVLTSGNINFNSSGNSTGLIAKYPGLIAFAEGNVDIGGNTTSVDPDGAIIYAGGDLRLRGTTDSSGISYLTQGVAEIIGGARIAYDGNAVADIGGDGDPLVLEWEELG